MKIVSVLISIIFLCNTTLYSCPGPVSKDTLRVPIGRITEHRRLDAQYKIFLSLTKGRLSENEAARYFRDRRRRNGNVLILDIATMQFEVKPANKLAEWSITGKDDPTDNYYVVYKLKEGERIDEYPHFRYVLVPSSIGMRRRGQKRGQVVKEVPRDYTLAVANITLPNTGLDNYDQIKEEALALITEFFPNPPTNFEQFCEFFEEKGIELIDPERYFTGSRVIVEDLEASDKLLLVYADHSDVDSATSTLNMAYLLYLMMKLTQRDNVKVVPVLHGSSANLSAGVKFVLDRIFGDDFIDNLLFSEDVEVGRLKDKCSVVQIVQVDSCEVDSFIEGTDRYFVIDHHEPTGRLPENHKITRSPSTGFSIYEEHVAIGIPTSREEAISFFYSALIDSVGFSVNIEEDEREKMKILALRFGLGIMELVFREFCEEIYRMPDDVSQIFEDTKSKNTYGGPVTHFIFTDFDTFNSRLSRIIREMRRRIREDGIDEPWIFIGTDVSVRLSYLFVVGNDPEKVSRLNNIIARDAKPEQFVFVIEADGVPIYIRTELLRKQLMASINGQTGDLQEMKLELGQASEEEGPPAASPDKSTLDAGYEGGEMTGEQEKNLQALWDTFVQAYRSGSCNWSKISQLVEILTGGEYTLAQDEAKRNWYEALWSSGKPLLVVHDKDGDEWYMRFGPSKGTRTSRNIRVVQILNQKRQRHSFLQLHLPVIRAHYGYVVTQSIPGKTLRDAIDQLSSDQLRSVGRQVLQLLEELRESEEENGFIYQDLFADNFVIQVHGSDVIVYLVDVGGEGFKWVQDTLHPDLDFTEKDEERLVSFLKWLREEALAKIDRRPVKEPSQELTLDDLRTFFTTLPSEPTLPATRADEELPFDGASDLTMLIAAVNGLIGELGIPLISLSDEPTEAELARVQQELRELDSERPEMRIKLALAGYSLDEDWARFAVPTATASLASAPDDFKTGSRRGGWEPMQAEGKKASKAGGLAEGELDRKWSEGVDQNVISLIREMQAVMREIDFPFPMWLFGSAGTYGARDMHDIDIALPMRLVKGEMIYRFIDELRTRLSPTGELWWGPTLKDKVELWKFLLPSEGDNPGIDPFLKASNKYVFRITPEGVQRFSRQTISVLWTQVLADCQRHVPSQFMASYVLLNLLSEAKIALETSPSSPTEPTPSLTARINAGERYFLDPEAANAYPAIFNGSRFNKAQEADLGTLVEGFCEEHRLIVNPPANVVPVVLVEIAGREKVQQLKEKYFHDRAVIININDVLGTATYRYFQTFFEKYKDGAVFNDPNSDAYNLEAIRMHLDNV